MTKGRRTPELGLRESVALMALMMSLVALSVDAMLPALHDIGVELAVAHANDTQLVISVLLAGMALGQLIYGPVSDSVGRKPPIYVGFALFLLGCLLSTFAQDYLVMLTGRFLQGLGAASPRIVTIALVRDQYEGRAMARVMSLIMSVFILVPPFAPIAGQGILLVAPWQAIFGMLFALALSVVVWFGLRQRETLPPERRRPFMPRRVASAMLETFRTRAAFGYMLAAGLIFGAFVGYRTSAQLVFQVQYGVGRLFPIYFGVLALAIGGATLTNSRLVMRHGMRRLSFSALVILSAVSILFLVLATALDGHPPLWMLMAYFLVSFFCIGIPFGNFNALAMEPMGHIAGSAAAVIGFLTTLISVSLGTWIGQSFDGTILPLVSGFAALSLAAVAVMAWTERGDWRAILGRAPNPAMESGREI